MASGAIQVGMSSTTISSAVGKRSAFANFSRSSTTCTRKPDLVRQAREVEPDVAGADDVQLGRRLDRLDVDVHLPAADEPGLLREIVRQLVVHQLRPAVGDRLARLPEGVVLVAAAADRADHPPVGEHEHLGADALRRRSVVETIVTSAAGSPRSSASATAAKTSWFTWRL